LALLFPIDWPEPFGLVMIEAMREGTPTIAWRKGSVPEVIDEGVTGFIVESVDEAVTALRRISLGRKIVRKRFEERFTASRMATNYIATYKGLLEAHRLAAPRDGAATARVSKADVLPSSKLPAASVGQSSISRPGVQT
jgi:glycogen synthase